MPNLAVGCTSTYSKPSAIYVDTSVCYNVDWTCHDKVLSSYSVHKPIVYNAHENNTQVGLMNILHNWFVPPDYRQKRSLRASIIELELTTSHSYILHHH